MAPNNHTLEKPSTNRLLAQVLDELKKVGVEQGVRKPGDGKYSALLREPTK